MGLLVVSAIGYAAATAGIKFASAGHSLPAFALMIGGFGLAAAAEVVLLRQSNLATVYLTIIGLETLLVLGLAFWLGDRPSGTQMAGGLMVMTGLVLVVSV
jgi:drug/metabolite transporter (DMT)-like permease